MPDTTDKQHILSFLRGGAWFGALPGGLQSEIIEYSAIRTYAAKEIISHESRPARGLQAILQGQISVSRLGGNNKDFLLHIGGPGFWFGELAVLVGGPTAVTFTARTKTRTLYLSQAKFDRIVADEPSYIRPFAEMIGQRMAMLIENFAASVSLPPDEYLRIRLADLVAMWRLDGVDDDVIEVALSQSDLARMLGVSRQTVNRFLQNLEADGLIETSFRSIRILEPLKLRRETQSTGS